MQKQPFGVASSRKTPNRRSHYFPSSFSPRNHSSSTSFLASRDIDRRHSGYDDPELEDDLASKNPISFFLSTTTLTLNSSARRPLRREKRKENNENDDLESFWRTRHQKVAFASMVASMLALNTTSFEGMDQMVANAMERDGAPCAIVFEIATSSSSSEKQELNDNAVANNNNNNVNEENKPELGQGFFKDLEIFIEREPPIAVGFLFLFLINGVWGVIFTLFIRETNAGPGGEFGKGLAALRKEIVKGIFKFFGGALGRFTK
jgi:superfamily II DNA helicase RecQ